MRNALFVHDLQNFHYFEGTSQVSFYIVLLQKFWAKLKFQTEPLIFLNLFIYFKSLPKTTLHLSRKDVNVMQEQQKLTFAVLNTTFLQSGRMLTDHAGR